jgi:hypothetical protein
MAAREMSRLNVSLTASIGNWEKNLEKAANKLVSFVGISKKTTDMLIGTLPKLTALFGGVGVAAGIKMAATRMDELAKASARLGVSSKELAGLQHAAAMGGSSAEGMTNALEKLTVQSEAALSGNKKLEDTFRSVGVSMDDLRRKNVSDVMSQIADGMQRLSGPGERMATTLELFGKGQHAMATVLADGSAGLKAMADEADALGLSVSRLDGKKIQAMNDAVENVANVSKGVFNQLAAEVSPIVTDIANGFVEWVKKLGGAKAITKAIVDTAIQGAGILGDIGQKLIITYKFIELGVMKIAAVLSVPLAKMIELEGKLDLFATKRERQLAIDKELAALEQKKAILMDQNLRLLDLGKTAVEEQGSAWVAPIMKVSEYMDAMKASAETGIEIAKLTEEEKKNAIIKANQDEAMEILKRMTALSSERKALNDKTVIDTVKMQSDILNNVAETEAEIKKLQAERSPSVQLAKYKEEIDAKREEDEKADAAKVQKTKETEDAITAEKIRALEARRLAEEEYRRSQIESQSLLGVFYQAENERAKESDWARTKSYMGTLNMQTAALAKHSKAMFAVNKGVSMANAVMNTAEGVTKAWSYGPILGPVLAGLVAAAGAAQIAVIAGTSYGQQSGSVASTGGVGAGDAAAAQASSNVGAPRQQAQDIIIYGDTISTDQLLRMTEQARERGVTLGGFRRG